MNDNLANLTDSQRDAFDNTPKKSNINLDQHGINDCFSLAGYRLSTVMKDIILVEYVDVTSGAGNDTILRDGIHIPIGSLQKAWRIGKVLLAGSSCELVKVGDYVCFPHDKGIKIANLELSSGIEVGSGVFLNEDRIFGICEEKQ
jgi:hypothetical protein